MPRAAGLLGALGAAWLVVYAGGGAHTELVHLMYVPILVTATRAGLIGTIVVAVAAAVLMGPLMPLDVDAATAQSSADWLARGAFYVVAACVTWASRMAASHPGGSRQAGREHEPPTDGDVPVAGRREPVTGLPDRKAMLTRLGDALDDLVANEKLVVCISLHVDRLKEINHAFGYDAGDEVLREVSRRLSDIIDPADLLTRSPDSFLVLAESLVEERTVAPYAERLLTAFHDAFDVAGEAMYLVGSVGVAVTRNERVRPGVLVQRSLIAAREASRHGGGRVSTYRPGIPLGAKRMRTETALRRALDNSELVLHYQPIVRVSTLEVVGLEALIRWDHPELALIPPAHFLPVAESSSLMRPMGRWILHEASQQLVEWTERFRHGRDWSLGVNISGVQLSHVELAADVQAALRSSGLPPHRLIVEIVEDLLGEHQIAEEQIRQLSNLGVRISIDDFGTGHSSLGRLRGLPVDSLKIDRSFVAELDDGGTSERSPGVTIVESIIGLAHTLDLEVVAEGVETGEQLEVLQRLGCDLAQGFLFSRPRSVDQIDAILERGQVALPAPAASAGSTHDRA